MKAEVTNVKHWAEPIVEHEISSLQDLKELQELYGGYELIVDFEDNKVRVTILDGRMS